MGLCLCHRLYGYGIYDIYIYIYVTIIYLVDRVDKTAAANPTRNKPNTTNRPTIRYNKHVRIARLYSFHTLQLNNCYW